MVCSIILPSWRRTASLLCTIDNIRETTKDVEIVVVLKRSDRMSQKAVKDFDVKTIIMPPDSHGELPLLCWQTGYEAASGDWFVMGADDYLYEPGWLEAALNCPNKGFVAFNDPHWGNMIAIQWMATKEYIDTVMDGYFGLPYYYSSWADNEVTARAKLSGRYAYCEGARYTHLNQAFLNESPDHIRRAIDEHYGDDSQTFYARHAAGFPKKWRILW